MIRSGLQESVHLLDIAVVDVDGNLVAFAGDPSRGLFARSSMKPLQAAVSLSMAGLDLSPREIAIVAASHNAEPVHLEAVRSILRKAGVDEAALQCPPRRSWDDALTMDAEERRPIHSDCSGKHAGMLAACRAQAWDLESYRDPDHPLQQLVLRTVLKVTGLERVDIGVDGCGVPVHGMPLWAMATIFARLSAPASWGGLADTVERVVRAMTSEPYMVAGRNRVDTAVMQATTGVVTKEGAEALICAGILDRGLGIAMRVRDGGWRAVGPGVIRVVEILGALTDPLPPELRELAAPPVLGGGEPVGEIQASFDLSWS